MGDTYTRQSTYVDGDVITSAHTNDEFDQLLAAFASGTGHSHDGTVGEGGAITGLFATSISFGTGGAGLDVTVTYEGETNDGVMLWKEDEDYFEFSDDILIATTEKVQFRDTAIYINSSADGQLDIVADTEIQIAATTIDINGAINASGEIIAASLDISGNVDIDGTTNLDSVDIDGTVQLDGTLTIGANDQGYDVILYGDTASANVTWDTSVDDLIFNGGAGLIVPEGQLTLGSTAISSTATELNLLDGVSGLVQADFTKLAAVDATAAELNIVDGGTSASSVTVADADRVVLNDAGTMKQVAVTDLATYFNGEITALPNLTSVGTLTALAVDDVAVDGKAITMTGSASDTAVITAGTNGTLSIVTTDAAAAAANITITADGTAELAGTTVTLNSSSNVTIDADGGTITFADAGSSLGAITSSGYSGTAALSTLAVVSDSTSNTNFPVVFNDESNALLDDTGALRYNPSTGTLLVPNLVVAGITTTVDTVTMEAENAIVFEGATADAHEITLSIVDPTSDHTQYLINQGGYIPVLAAITTTAITSTPAELNLLDTAVAGTIVNSKAVIYSSGGQVNGTTLAIAGTAITATAAEINIIDGDTSAVSTTLVDADRFVTNDNGTMKQVALTNLKTYLSSAGFGTIDDSTALAIALG
mgnify:FL=1